MIQGFAGLAVPVVLAATAVVLGACTSESDSDGAASGGSDSTVSESSTKQPTYSPEAGEVVTVAQDQKWATMEQGRYAVQLAPSLTYEVDVPDQWRVYEGRFLNPPPSGANSIFFVASAPADSTELPQHPCDDPSGTRVGPSVSDLAHALRQQPVLEVSRPDPVTVDGSDGLYVDVRIPDEVDSSTCVDDTVALFSTGSDDWGWTEGFVGQWWILSVDGKRVVINGQCDPACADHDFDALTTMAESVTFPRAQ
jgi:hypothetical protein